MPTILGANSVRDTGYNVDNSLIFNDGDSPVLSKTASSAGNKRTWTISWWFKRSTLGSMTFFWQDGASTDHETKIAFDGSNRLFVYDFDGTSFNMLLKTNRNFRDMSSWYNAVIAVDTTDGTAANRIKMYINGVQETSFETATYPSQNHETEWNSDNELRIAKDSSGEHFDGYLTEIVNVDGTQLAQTSLGEFDEDSPTIWKPIELDLTFGTNGFHLDFEDSSALGTDVSGNNNDFTPSNLAATDQSTDTCTNNFATYNALLSQVAGVDGRHGSWNGQLAEGNLSSGTAVDNYNNQFSTFGLTSGKWYAEFKMSTTDNNFSHGIVNDVFFSGLGSYIGQSTASGVRNIGYYSQTGQVLKNNSAQYTGSTYGVSGTDVISIALDLDNNFVYFAKNGTFQNSGNPASGSSGTGGVAIDADTTWFLGSTTHSLSSSGLKISYANFGSPPTGFTISSGNADGEGFGNFEFAVPSDYFAICSKNLSEYGG